MSRMVSTADCECGRLTKLPSLRRRSIMRAFASWVSTLLTVMREHLYCFISSCSTGIFCPGGHSPDRIRFWMSERIR